MTDSKNSTASETGTPDKDSNWGAWLFYGTFVVLLIFFWWLLIDSGGVSGHHG